MARRSGRIVASAALIGVLGWADRRAVVARGHRRRDPPGDGDGDGDPCVDIIPELSPEPSTVIFLVDQGSHMTNNFAGGLTQAIGAALFDRRCYSSRARASRASR